MFKDFGTVPVEIIIFFAKYLFLFVSISNTFNPNSLESDSFLDMFKTVSTLKSISKSFKCFSSFIEKSKPDIPISAG